MPSNLNHFPITWFGNKRVEVNYIIPNLNLEGKKTIIEPFCGSAAISFWIWKIYGDKFNYILNDKDEDLYNIYKYLIENDIEYIEKEINKLRKEITTKELFNEYKIKKDVISIIVCNVRTIDINKTKLKSYSNIKYKFNKLQLDFIKFIKSSCVKVCNKDWKDIFDEFKDDKESILLFDPPYINTYNDTYRHKELTVYDTFKKKNKYKASIYFILEEIKEVEDIFGSPIHRYSKYYSIRQRIKTHAIYLI